MAHDPRLSTASADAAANAMAALYDSGYLRLYAGTKPADANTALTTQTLVVEHRFPSPAFGASAGGVATANAIANAVVSGLGPMTFFRCFASDGTTVLLDGTVALSGADLRVDALDPGIGVTNRVNSFTLAEVM